MKAIAGHALRRVTDLQLGPTPYKPYKPSSLALPCCSVFRCSSPADPQSVSAEAASTPQGFRVRGLGFTHAQATVASMFEHARFPQHEWQSTISPVPHSTRSPNLTPIPERIHSLQHPCPNQKGAHQCVHPVWAPVFAPRSRFAIWGLA